MTHQPRISVVVPTRNRPDVLEACLRSILDLDYADFEVIVVDQSTDSASEKIATGLGDERLTYLPTNTVGRARSVNIGVSRATAEIIAFTDDDCTVPANWLTRIAEVFAREASAGIYYGPVEAPIDASSDALTPTYLPSRYRVIKGRFIDASILGMGANMAVRRSVFDMIGGFDPLMGVGSTLLSGEDWELTYRALRAGFSVVDDPEVAVMHYGARTFADGQAARLMMGYFFGHGAGYVRNARKGDLIACWLLARELFLISRDATFNLLRGTRPLGVGRLTYVLRGAWAGARCSNSRAAQAPALPLRELA